MMHAKSVSDPFASVTTTCTKQIAFTVVSNAGHEEDILPPVPIDNLKVT